MKKRDAFGYVKSNSGNRGENKTDTALVRLQGAKDGVPETPVKDMSILVPLRNTKRRKNSGDCTTVATQPEATTLLQQFIKKKKKNELHPISSPLPTTFLSLDGTGGVKGGIFFSFAEESRIEFSGSQKKKNSEFSPLTFFFLCMSSTELRFSTFQLLFSCYNFQ